MTDNFSRKAKFEQVKYDMDAVRFHASKYIGGSVYQLSKECFQYIQLLKIRTPYDIYLDQLEEESGVSNTKP